MSKIIDISNHYFHGVGGQINFLNDENFYTCLSNLESIIQHKYILTRENIIKNNIDIHLVKEHNGNFNGDQYVSICFNPYDVILYDDWKDIYSITTDDIAYEMFVLKSIACVFDNNVLNYLELRTGNYTRQQDELQIKGNIPFNLVKYIALNDRTSSEAKIKKYKELKKLLEKYNLSIPIITTGRSKHDDTKILAKIL